MSEMRAFGELRVPRACRGFDRGQRLDGFVLVVKHVKDGQQFSHLKQVLRDLGEIQQFDIAQTSGFHLP